MNDSDKQCRFENRIPGISDSNTDLKLFAKAILKAAGKERMCLEQAKHLILAGEQKAIHIGVPMVLAVVDVGGKSDCPAPDGRSSSCKSFHRSGKGLYRFGSPVSYRRSRCLRFARTTSVWSPKYPPRSILSLWRRHSFILRNVLHRSHRRIRRHR